MRIHKTILLFLYLGGFSIAGIVVAKGFQYYTLPRENRPHSSLHADMKPSGLWGHGVGILGSSMILLLFLYSARKRQLFGLRFGQPRKWLNVHIFFGILGPVFVTLHTTFKFGGIVSISYYSMMAVMLSGFVGRYLYVQIPRKLSGVELTMKEMEEKNKLMSRLLVEEYGIKPQALQQIQRILGVEKSRNRGKWASLFLSLKSDLLRPFRIWTLKKSIQKKYPAKKELNALIDVVKQKSLLSRKMSLLSTIQPVFHYWHIIHKPFAIVMVAVMFIHIAVVLLFGYRWIF